MKELWWRDINVTWHCGQLLDHAIIVTVDILARDIVAVDKHHRTVIVTGKFSKVSLIFESKVGVYPCGTLFSWLLECLLWRVHSNLCNVLDCPRWFFQASLTSVEMDITYPGGTLHKSWLLILHQPIQGCTNLTVANALAYFAPPSVTKKAVFKTLTKARRGLW
jgi:hypothetical protein